MKVGIDVEEIKILINIKFKDIDSFIAGGAMQS
jgi:hypothetical protein